MHQTTNNSVTIQQLHNAAASSCKNVERGLKGYKAWPHHRDRENLTSDVEVMVT